MTETRYPLVEEDQLRERLEDERRHEPPVRRLAETTASGSVDRLCVRGHSVLARALSEYAHCLGCGREVALLSTDPESLAPALERLAVASDEAAQYWARGEEKSDTPDAVALFRQLEERARDRARDLRERAHALRASMKGAALDVAAEE